MAVKNKNYAYKNPECSDGETFEYCNFTQLVPNTELFEDKTGLTFNNCNLINCKVPADSVIKDCNTAQIERCSHNHPELLKRGLKQCTVDCKHRKSAIPVNMEITEGEFRKDKVNCTIDKTDDADGVTIQKFYKQSYEYTDTVQKKEQVIQ